MVVPSLRAIASDAVLADPLLAPKDKLRVLQQLKEMARDQGYELEMEMQRRQRQHDPNEREPSRQLDFGDTQEEEEPRVVPPEVIFEQIDRELEDEQLKLVKQAKLAKQKSDLRQKQFTWKQRYVQNVHKCQLLEREVFTTVRHPKAGDMPEYSQLDKQMKLAQRRLNGDGKDVRQQIAKSKMAVKLLRSHVDRMGFGEQYMIKLEELMETAEGVIATTKLKFGREYQALADERANLEVEVVALAELFEKEAKMDLETKQLQRKGQRAEWKQTLQQTHQPPVSARRVVDTASAQDKEAALELKADIAKIDQEIAALGGSTGTWDSKDHATVLQLLSRCRVRDSWLLDKARTGEQTKAIDAVVSRALKLIPMHDERSIRRHLHWYGKYQHLIHQKSDRVKRWKHIKASATSHVPKGVDENVASTGNKATVQSARRDKALVKKNNDLKRKAVLDWKNQKAAMERAKQEKAQVDERVRKEQDLRRRAARDKTKDELALFKLQKDAQRAKQRMKQEQDKHPLQHTSPAHRPTKRQLQALHERDQRIVQKKLQDKKKLNKETREEMISKLVARSAPKVTRDSRRLVRPTRAYLGQRITEDEREERDNQRYKAGAHDAIVPSTYGAARGGKSYSIGVRDYSSRAPASWKSTR